MNTTYFNTTLPDVLADMQDQIDNLIERVAMLESWIAAACRADRTLLPPAGIEINHQVAPTAHR